MFLGNVIFLRKNNFFVLVENYINSGEFITNEDYNNEQSPDEESCINCSSV